MVVLSGDYMTVPEGPDQRHQASPLGSISAWVAGPSVDRSSLCRGGCVGSRRRVLPASAV